MVLFDAAVSVPLAAGAGVELYEPHAPLDEPAGEEAIAAEGAAFVADVGLVQAV